jgi:AraC-like DNA-binding protein
MSLDELRSLIDRHALAGRDEFIKGARVWRSESASTGGVSTTGTVVALIAQGEKTLGLGDRLFHYAPGEYLVSSIDLPVTGGFSGVSPERPALGFGLTLRPELVADLLLSPGATGLDPGGRSLPVPAGLAVSRAPEELIDAIVRLLRLLDRPRDLPVLAPLIEREIVWTLMTGDQGATVRQLGLADSGLNRIGLAVKWMRDHYAETIRIDDLAQLTRMSPSAFHRGFHSVTGMSPIQFQKQIRLQEARILLVAQPGDVSSVAFLVGYESASQFSREYRRLFGTAPGRDAARLREREGV